MYKTTVSMQDERRFETTINGQKVVMDTGDDPKTHPSPMDMVLAAVGGCASVDVVSILQKRRKTVQDLRIEVTAQRRDEPFPRIFTNINLMVTVVSPDVTKEELRKAVALSVDKYCSVAGMLREASNLTWDCQVEAAK